ncbi:MAG: dTMP kinase [Acidobacteria bacterium]|nr:dTMP kinase [Acidobacteriota bacterium]
MAHPGFFLTFEGVDGCGKTTQLERFAARVEAAGVPFVRAQEPGGTRIGREIRRLLLDSRNVDLAAIPELLLYFASRAQNIAEVIGPALAGGKLVISDRFTDATVAYQGYGRELGPETVSQIDAVACQGLEPDMTLWLDLDPAVAVARALGRAEATGGADESRMEREARDFHERVREGYRALWKANPERIVRIDAAGSIEQVEQAIVEAAWPAITARVRG